MPIHRASGALLAAALLLAACDDGPGDATDEAAESAEEVDEPGDDEAGQDPAEAVREVDPAQVTLLEAGAEPRAPLRLDLAEGSEVTATLGFEEEVLEEGTSGEPGPPQSGSIELRLTVTDVEDGHATIAFAYEEVSVDGQPLEGPNPMTGVEGEIVLDDRSRLVGTTDSASGLDQLPIALPEEEVGVGAVWEVRTEEVFRLPATEILTVELLAVDGDEYELALDATTEGPGEPTPLPGAGEQPGGRLMLDELERDSTGEQRASRSLPFPVRSSLTTRTLLVVSLDDDTVGPQPGPAPDADEHQRQELREQVVFERH